jgi:hypothetical protein
LRRLFYLLIFLSVLLGARNRQAQVSELGGIVAAVERPASGWFEPANQEAAAVSGGINITPQRLTSARGLHYRTRSAGWVQAYVTDGAGNHYETLLQLAGGRIVELRRVTREAVDDYAPAGGFCGSNPAVMFAIAYEIRMGERQLRLAAYADNEGRPRLCGLYFYRNAGLLAGSVQPVDTPPADRMPVPGEG